MTCPVSHRSTAVPSGIPSISEMSMVTQSFFNAYSVLKSEEEHCSALTEHQRQKAKSRWVSKGEEGWAPVPHQSMRGGAEGRVWSPEHLRSSELLQVEQVCVCGRCLLSIKTSRCSYCFKLQINKAQNNGSSAIFLLVKRPALICISWEISLKWERKRISYLTGKCRHMLSSCVWCLIL